MNAPLTTAAQLLLAARELAPQIKERAVQAERDRQIPSATVDAYKAAGLVRTLMPRRWGGHELSFDAAFDVAIEIGRSTCGSSAWCLTYLTDHSYLLAHFPEAAQAEVWGSDPDAGIATSFAPSGQVEIVDGGYRLTGSWAWASGIAHSDWILLGGLVFPQDGHPDLLLFLVPKRDLQVQDVWFNVGLRASGSNTVVLDKVFVPAHRTVSLALLREAESPGSAHNTADIYKVPLIAISSYALAGPAIGVARGAHEDWVQWTRGKVAKYTGNQVAAQVTTQIRLAEVAATIDAAELLVRRNLQVAAGPLPLDLAQRVRNRRDFCMALRLLVKAMDGLMEISGASGGFDSNPIQRAWRDVRTISSHVIMNFEAAAENFGRLELGLDRNPKDPFF